MGERYVQARKDEFPSKSVRSLWPEGTIYIRCSENYWNMRRCSAVSARPPLVAAKALLDPNPNPTETETRYGLAGNPLSVHWLR
jgi:hypothetical protein